MRGKATYDRIREALALEQKSVKAARMKWGRMMINFLL
jgi:hypothetical protein